MRHLNPAALLEPTTSRGSPESEAPPPLTSWIVPAAHRGTESITTSMALVDALHALGVERAFGVLGGGIGPFAGALASSPIQLLHCRSEAGASFAAIEDSLASGRLTVVVATTGPGLTSLVTGMAAARSEGAHVLFVSGVTSAGQRGRSAFQETTAQGGLASLFQPGQLLDHAQVIEDAAELPGLCARLANGLERPSGFVAHVGIPLDVQTSDAVRVPLQVNGSGPSIPSPATLERCRALLRPGRFVIWAGFGVRHAARQVRELAERTGAPVICSPRAKGVMPEDHPLYLGVTGLGGHSAVHEYFKAQPVERVLVLGSRLGEMTSFWASYLAPEGGFVHVDIDDSVFGAAYPGTPTFGVRCDVGSFLTGLVAEYDTHDEPWPDLPPRRLAARGAHVPGLVRYSALLDAMQRQVVEQSNAIVLTEAGNSFMLGSYYLRFGEPRRYRVSTRFGSMGQAAAGVLGAACGHGRAVALVGDGTMLMFNELSTAAKYRIPAVWIVLNDARYGMVEDGMRAVGWEPFETDFPRTDFAAVARAMGVDATRVVEEDALDEALKRALAHDGPFLVDVWITPSEPAPKNQRNDSLVSQGINAEATQ